MLPPVTPGLALCAALALTGSAVQVLVGAGLSVVCGPALMLWLGPKSGLPILLGLNLLVSVVASLFDARAARWGDATRAAAAMLAGGLGASFVPGLSDTVLKTATAAALLVVALPRPPAPDRPPRATAALAGVVAAGLVTGALTVWTATPGPMVAMALARAGRSGNEIRRTMQPISTVGYGAALFWTRAAWTKAAWTSAAWASAAWAGGTSAIGHDPTAGAGGIVAALVASTLIGIGGGFWLRPRVEPARVVLAVRLVAAAAAALLLVSAWR